MGATATCGISKAAIRTVCGVVPLVARASARDWSGRGRNHGLKPDAANVSENRSNALTTKFATELADTPLRVNAVCAGLPATAPGMEAMGTRPVPEGAASVVRAATLPDDGPTGGFFRDGKPLPW